jgi:hypothetical protein
MIQVHDLRSVEPGVVLTWVEHLTSHLRRSDIDEVEAMGGVSPATALAVSLSLSSHAFAVLGRRGEPIAMFGAAPHPLPGLGVVWMLGSDGIDREATAIGRRSRRFFRELADAYPLGLWNYIDARNKKSMRWLRWGGFKLLGDHTMPSGHLFHIFAKTG